MSVVPIITRHDWQATHGVGSLDPGPEGNVVIHHTYKPALLASATKEQEAAAVLGIEHHHTHVQKWAGIGYNFLVAPSGRIYEGRGWKYRGSHAGPINGDSIGIALMIDGNRQTPSDAMIASVQQLIAMGVRLGEIATGYKISGHRDHMARECPGDIIYGMLDQFYPPPSVAIPDVDVIPEPEISVPAPAPDLYVDPDLPYPVRAFLRHPARVAVATLTKKRESETFLSVLERSILALLQVPDVRRRLGFTLPIVEWAVGRLFDAVQKNAPEPV